MTEGTEIGYITAKIVADSSSISHSLWITAHTIAISKYATKYNKISII